MKSRITLILLCLMTLFPSFCKAQYGFDVASVEAYINEEQGRRRTLIEQSRRRWLRYAANSAHSDGYNGKYDEEDE